MLLTPYMATNNLFNLSNKNLTYQYILICKYFSAIVSQIKARVAHEQKCLNLMYGEFVSKHHCRGTY